MAQFLLDFQAFFTLVLSAIGDFYVWFSQTIIGEIILFMVIMYIFLYVIRLVISLKD